MAGLLLQAPHHLQPQQQQQQQMASIEAWVSQQYVESLMSFSSVPLKD
jgi:hypothetical protein